MSYRKIVANHSVSNPGEPTELEVIGDDPAWKSAGGEVVRIGDMTDDHLVNAIKWVRRTHDTKVLNSCEVAICGSVEDAVAAYDLSGPEATCHRAYPRLLEEAVRRGLKVTFYE